MPLFSVIIPAYNRVKLIQATIDSVLAQSCRDFELLVVDDGSTDATAAVVEQHYGAKVRLLRQENRGQSTARNLGIAQARGRYIALLDSDDLWFPWTLETYLQAIKAHDEPAFISGSHRYFNQPEELAQVQRQPPDFLAFDDYWSARFIEDWIATSGVAIRREALMEAGSFIQDRCGYEECDLWLRLGHARGFVRIHRPACFAYRWHEDNFTHRLGAACAGVNRLIDCERADQYPGGARSRRGRLQIITRHARPLSLQCLRRGRADLAWRLYRRTLGWHLQLGRLRYLAGFPLISLRQRLVSNNKTAKQTLNE